MAAVQKTIDDAHRKQLRVAMSDPDVATRQSNGRLLRERFAQHEKKLSPELWSALMDALDVAEETGEVGPLELAVANADLEIKSHKHTTER